MWDLDNEENYILSLDGHSGYDPNENITCLAFSTSKGMFFVWMGFYTAVIRMRVVQKNM